MIVPNSAEKLKFNFFFFLITLLGIISPHPIITGKKNTAFQRFYKLYAAFLILILTLMGITTQICNLQIFQSKISNFTLIVTSGLMDSTTTICSIVTVLVPTFLYSSSFDLLLDNGRIMCSTSFVEEISKITSSKQFTIRIIVCHIILLIFFTFDGYVWILAFGLEQYSGFIFQKILIYHSFAIVVTIYVFVRFIKTQLEITNDYLTEKLESGGINNGRSKNLAIEVFPIKSDIDKICSEIRHVSQFYEYHVKQVALFNKLFGCQLLFLVLSFVMGCINSINLIIFFFLSNIQVDLRADLILTHLLWTLWQLGIGGIAVVMCTETEEVGKATGDICLNTLTNLPYSSENERIKEELLLLNRLVNQKSPTFSAAGFFSINYSLLLNIIGSITSYVIVLIQFYKV